MNLLNLIIGPVTEILGRVIPDPNKRAELQAEMIRLQQAGEFKEIDAALQRDLAQMEVNKAEAASGNAFASSWRPLAGYVCVIGLAYQFFIQPLCAWLSGIQAWPTPPELDMGDLVTILGGMLGMSAMRTKERLSGVIAKGK